MIFIDRKHAPLAGLMPTGGGLVPFTDSVVLFGTTGLQTSYFFNNLTQKWIDTVGTDSSSVIVRPGQRRSSSRTGGKAAYLTAGLLSIITNSSDRPDGLFRW